MSGIAAVLNLDGSAVPKFEIERMRNVLKPYGPDQQEIVLRRNAAFVACLHYLTPEDAFERQPLPVSNRFVTLFDGRIDNREELSEALGISGNELSSMPDSVLVFRLLDRWGKSAFNRIVGPFAVIVADLQDGELICARDQLGQRVLHYHRTDDRFAVATCPEALFALSWIPRVLNEDQVADHLLACGTNEESTFYRNVNRVAFGSMLRVCGARLTKN